MSSAVCSTRFGGGVVLSALLLGSTLLALPLRAQTSVVPSGLELTEDQKILHVLNRLAYGPRPGDVARVRAMGIEAYIEEQLSPETIRSPVLERMLEHWTEPYDDFEALLRLDQPPTAPAVAERARRSLLEKVNASTTGRGGRDPNLTERLRASLRSDALSGMVMRREGRRWEDLIFWRAIYSESQLEQMMVDFWFNHFNITTGEPAIGISYEEDVIRRHALGKFEDMLIATATHPGMVVYLDNWLSTAPAEVVAERLNSGSPPDGEPRTIWARRNVEFLEMANGLNENYGRELMELHTLGVDGGYTQQDVQEVARAFTGWTVTGIRQHGGFVFNPLLHVDGDKTVLGQTIPSGGMDEGMAILRMLADHPSTAHYVSTKLVRRFVADDPPPSIVAAASERFLETDGDIREVLRAIFFHPDFFSPDYYQVKVKKPIEAVVSALRAVDAQIDVTFLGPNFGNVTSSMGERMRAHEAPDGFPDVAEAWMSTNSLFQRIRFAMVLATESIEDITIDLDAARDYFREAGFPEPTPDQIAAARELFAAMQQEEESGEARMRAEQMAGGDPAAPGGGRGRQPGAGPELDYESLEAKVVAVALVLGSPDFIKR